MCNSILVTVLAANANYGFCSPANNTIIRSGLSKSCIRKERQKAHQHSLKTLYAPIFPIIRVFYMP